MQSTRTSVAVLQDELRVIALLLNENNQINHRETMSLVNERMVVVNRNIKRLNKELK